MGLHPYLLPFGIYDGLRSHQAVGGDVFPHGVGAVGHKLASQHPTGQGEMEVHTDMII